LPQLLPNGLPERAKRYRFDFREWADGQAWKFLRGDDYTSTTDSFRYNIQRWAKANGYEVETRPLPATDDRGRPLPATKAEPVGLAVRFKLAAPVSRDHPRSPSAGSRAPITRVA
jgi:hypothetical protein